MKSLKKTWQPIICLSQSHKILKYISWVASCSSHQTSSWRVNKCAQSWWTEMWTPHFTRSATAASTSLGATSHIYSRKACQEEVMSPLSCHGHHVAHLRHTCLWLICSTPKYRMPVKVFLLRMRVIHGQVADVMLDAMFYVHVTAQHVTITLKPMSDVYTLVRR